MKIFGRKDDGLWEEKLTISHDGRDISAIFSADGRYLLSTHINGTAKIHGQEIDGSWSEKVIISHDESIISVGFSAGSQYVITITKNNNVHFNKLLMKLD
ncbi:hypothetical protein [Endozoicomonas sp. ALD040]|uniref:hypothetical protein n=1 Tax=unclassified Endozoicomonas TaxID=2644528 RepID=UPI003BAE8D5D